MEKQREDILYYKKLKGKMAIWHRTWSSWESFLSDLKLHKWIAKNNLHLDFFNFPSKTSFVLHLMHSGEKVQYFLFKWPPFMDVVIYEFLEIHKLSKHQGTLTLF